MSYSIAQRTFKHNVLFASAACMVALTLTAGPAFAETPLDRVEISGRVIEAPARYDVRASCYQPDAQLKKQLMSTWFRERQYGQVDVRFVVTDGQVNAVNARGVSMRVAHDVKRAVSKLSCPNAQAGTSIYRLQVAFVDPSAPVDNTAVASADQADKVAIFAMR